MISKTTVRLCWLCYIFGYYILFLLPYEARLGKSGVKITRRIGFTGKLVDHHLVGNIVLRLVLNFALLVVYALVPDVETWEYVLLLGFGVLNFFFVGLLACFIVFEDELVTVINSFILWNKNLAKFYDQPELIEKDGLEPILKFFTFWIYICIPFTIPIVTGGISGFLFELKLARVPLEFIFAIIGLPSLAKPVAFFGAWYILATSCVILVAIGSCVILINSQTLWVIKHSRYSTEDGGRVGCIENIRIYRGLAVMHKLLARPAAQAAEVLFTPFVSVLIVGIAILFKYYKTFPFLATLYLLTFLVLAVYAGGVATQYAVKISEYSTLYPNQLNMEVRKEDKVFARSCRPFRFKIGRFVTVTTGTYPNIIKDIVIQNVIDFFLFIRRV